MSVSHVSHDLNPPVSMSGPCSRSFPSASRRCSSAMMPHKSLASKSSSTNSTRCSRSPSVRRRARLLERHDVDLPHVFIDAEKHHRAYRCEKTYLCAVGPVTAMRTLYRARPGERAVAAMERKVGIVEGYWTAHAARQGAMLTAHLVPREAEEVLGVLGNMTPSKSSLDRLPKALSARWEAQRPQFESESDIFSTRLCNSRSTLSFEAGRRGNGRGFGSRRMRSFAFTKTS